MSNNPNSKNTVLKKTKISNTPDNGRRYFLTKIWKALGAVAGLELAALTFQYLAGERTGSERNIKFSAGSAESFPKNSVTAFRGERFYLARLNDGGFLALSLKCTHLGCSIIWDEKSGEFICPCHSSRFGFGGAVTKPPAPRPLDYYSISIEAGEVVVHLGKKIRRDKFEKSQVVYV